MLLPSPRIGLPELACLSSLPGVLVLDQSAVRHQTAARHTRTFWTVFWIGHFPTEKPLPCPRSHTGSEK
ncbi:hypothetical protein ATANTOWER_016629 [Ataeniobius toweri]|uniref:Secreted protein n=1 Tax=Ataeniobius toweri TaxID=208326 RepID=A0ABU7C128_9TELE|nr:hypothetical protein [Ataeniobius toweri]